MRLKVFVTALAAALYAVSAPAQIMGTSVGPAFNQQFGNSGTSLLGPRCFNHHRSPDDRLKSCKVLADEDTSSWISLAEAYRLAHRYDDALAFVTSHLNKVQDDPDGLEERSVIYAVRGEYDKALADADKQVTLVANSSAQSEAYNNRCWIRAIAGRELDAAIADCNRALELDIKPSDPFVLDSRGFAYFKMGDFKAAIADYDTALKGDRHRASALYMRGMAKLKSGDTSAAKADIEEATTTDPYIADEFSTYGIPPAPDGGT